jgi:hypothetical protein
MSRILSAISPTISGLIAYFCFVGTKIFSIGKLSGLGIT